MAKVLVVLDGAYRFSETDAAGMDTGGTDDFTYMALTAALESAGHQVTKAHRQTDTSANISMFNFESSVNLLDFDVIWLIGHQGRNSPENTGTSIAGIDDQQVRAIAQFMDAGGGVFATGDHDSIGSVMCGRILRIRAMRAWYGINDTRSEMDPSFPRNFPSLGALRADTTQRNPAGDYGGDTTFVWFENQSDSVPQPMTPSTSPAHPILRKDGNDIVIYPDHMHEGKILDGNVMGYNYDQTPTFDGESFVEFRAVAGNQERPQVIAHGQTNLLAVKYSSTGDFVYPSPAATEASAMNNVNTLSVYDGRKVGVGRIVTASTFHHYVDINLTGDRSVDTMTEITRATASAQKNHGFNDAAAPIFDNIKAVFVNITNWLARPHPTIQIILERSTFSQAEATATPNFNNAILVIVDGLKPTQFPGGGIDSFANADFDPNWAPTITPLEPAGLNIVPIDVDTDDPLMPPPDRLQRITFKYRVEITAAAAFAFAGDFNHVQVNAQLTSPAVSGTLTDSAQITLVKSANPFMLDLDAGNTEPWLSTDVRVFPVIAGSSGLPDNATRGQANSFIQTLVSSMTVAQFQALPTLQEAAKLSPIAMTTGASPKRVYNFAVARVRLPASGGSADDVRVFFRIFVSQTTAALTYNEVPAGTPIEGYRKTAATVPIALPGITDSGNEWLSFPMFAANRTLPPEGQLDNTNLKDGLAAGSSTFFGALLDTNLADINYLPDSPTSMGGPVPLTTLLMGEHQCIVAQIEFAGTPIPNGANPFTSDKLAQRNIAYSPIANPGLDASRMAVHTFEIEAAPNAMGDGSPSDELLLEWHGGQPPERTEVHLEIPAWNAQAIIDLADRFYPRHELRALDSHTIAVPGGGMRYVPIPRSNIRQTGVITVHFPLGVKVGQRFDLSVRQVTTRRRVLDIDQPKATTISREEAARLLQDPDAAGAPVPRGVFDIGNNRTLITDLRVLDAEGDHAVIVQHPDPREIEAARREARRWRETIGAFQLGIPVAVKDDMVVYHLRLLSVLRWRAEWLRPNSRWYHTFIRYVDLMAEKVRALGGDPYSVPPTPDGNVDLHDKDEVHEGCLAFICRILFHRRRR